MNTAKKAIESTTHADVIGSMTADEFDAMLEGINPEDSVTSDEVSLEVSTEEDDFFSELKALEEEIAATPDTVEEVVEVKTADVKVEKPEKAKKEPKAAKPKVEKAPVSGTIKLSKSGEGESSIEDILKPLKVKVINHAKNLIAHVQTGKSLSVFASIGMKFARAHFEDGFTTSMLMEHFMSKSENGIKGYAKSTATPQAANYVATGKALGLLVTREGRHFINADSALWDKIA